MDEPIIAIGRRDMIEYRCAGVLFDRNGGVETTDDLVALSRLPEAGSE